jgi:hypothetical protein
MCTYIVCQLHKDRDFVVFVHRYFYVPRTVPGFLQQVISLCPSHEHCAFEEVGGLREGTLNFGIRAELWNKG